ncbi:MAG: B12-binding domain-containing radical SAM protein [Pseudomonadota bacterium]|nr:B12-binding domain-containing radical SAM protein [Pseudomonadota bacterium]
MLVNRAFMEADMALSSDVTSPLRRTRYRPKHQRRILCIFPHYAPSFGTFQYAYPLVPGVRAFMPPQGLLVIAAYLPAEWQVRLVDENIRPPSAADFQWADAVFMSGMHAQRARIDALNKAAHRYGKLTVLGGPSVSGCAEYYPEVDILHVGELGDATDAVIKYIDKNVTRPSEQLRFTTTERLALENFPIPAYDLIDMRRYFLGSIQFSSGCPYQCEFCDIPELYGRRPRLKTLDQIGAELDAIVKAGARGAVYFVDDNFIGNRKAARELLPYLIDWQRTRGYPLRFACEATLNIAQQEQLLLQMREASFHTVFCGIETPEPDALRLMRKKQNLTQPIIESVDKLNAHGMEVVAGIILGLDTDTPATADHLLTFIEASHIPMLTINLLYALPRTPLYRRLQQAERLIDDGDRVSNVQFKMPYEQVVDMWRRCIGQAYDPPRLLERFAYQTAMTFPKRLLPPRKVKSADIALGMNILSRVLWTSGLRADHRHAFWRLAKPLLRAGRIEDVIHIGVVSHHLISFTQQALTGRGEACFYADPSRATHPTL